MKLRLILILTSVTSMLVVPAMSQGRIHKVNCGSSKVIYEDSPGANEHTITLPGNPPNPSHAAFLAELEAAAASQYMCKGCPLLQTGCASSITSDVDDLTWGPPVGGGTFPVLTEGLTITFHCSACSGN
jgi:hypothetical protein